MSYSSGHDVRLIGGRLALDFLNTADWSRDGAVVHEKLESLEDARVWMAAVGLPGLQLPTAAELRAFRAALRALFLTPGSAGVGLEPVNAALRDLSGDVLARADKGGLAYGRGVTLPQVIALSAASILADPREVARIKRCPGDDCGWLFLDETKNARRKWCSMETCGNRAKARRNYARSKREAAEA